MKIKVYKVSSFVKTGHGGNNAGVVLDGDGLTEADMIKISSYIGFSETAFVMNSDRADFKVRFFTPSEEVDLCGHGTIATYFILFSLGHIKPGFYKQETKAGILGIEVMEDGMIMMNQCPPEFYQILDQTEVADSLNINPEQLFSELPIQIISTGIRDILVPVKDLSVLNKIQPDFNKVKEISKKYDVIGYHVFSLETINQAAANCRNFAPLYDIPEESATGTSNGALGCYLYRYGQIDKLAANHIIIEQGYTMKKPSEIMVSLGIEKDKILEVKVGGNASVLAWEEVEL